MSNRKLHEIKLPEAGTTVKCRKPGPLSLEEVLRQVPVINPADPTPAPAPAKNEAEQLAADATAQRENLRLAKAMIDLCTVEPHYAPTLDPGGDDVSQDELSLLDFWVLFGELWKLSGITDLYDRLGPMLPGATPGSSTTGSPGATTAAPASSRG